MARVMFKYTKNIIKKVDFNDDLMKKELEKAKERLLPYEIPELIIWMEKEYSDHKKLGEFTEILKTKANSA